MPKKGGKHMGETEKRRLAVIPDLYAIYSTYFSEAVIDMIAKQCDYDLDTCIATLADMMQDGTAGGAASTGASKLAAAVSSSIASPSASSPAAAPASQPTEPSQAVERKKGILFLSPRPKSDLLIKQPPSVWKKGDAPAQPATHPWAGTRSGSNDAASPAASSLPHDPDEFDESAYGSDANDEPMPRPSRYSYTGFETSPYFALQPEMLAEVPPLIDVQGGIEAALDPQAPSSKRWTRPALPVEGAHAASPAHPHHHLHALYLQLSAREADTPVQKRAGMFTARPASAAATLSTQIEEDLTPAQAAKLAAERREADRQRKKAEKGWLKQHEQEKRSVRAQIFSAVAAGGAPVEAEEQQAASESDPQAQQASSAADQLTLVTQTSGESEQAEDDDTLPADIPHMSPLTRAESQASFERVRARPQELELLLAGLFPEVDQPVIRAIVESLVSGPPPDATTGERDIAQEACDTLLAMVAEQEAEAAGRFDEVSAPPARAVSKKIGKKSHQQQQQQTPFVPSGHQMTDEELAIRMSMDPDFDPEAVRPLDANVGLKPANAASQSAPLKKNKRGHIVLPRGPANVWALSTPATSASASQGSLEAAAPDLSAQWKLAALKRTFPTLEPEVIEETFIANGHNFQQAKAHLKEIYPTTTIIESERPAPVEQPWSQTTMHHSKVTSTSRQDAERGIVKNGPVADWDSPSSSNAAAAAIASLSDAELEATLGPLLDNRGSSSSSGGNLRAEASMHARRRAAYISAAVGAFTRGNGGLAADLASKGQAAAKALASTSARAGIEIFVHANANSDCTRSVDLHGLHVQEALRLVPFILRRRSNAGGRELSLVTGVGHHSQGGVRGAKLGPAIVEYLKRAGYSYSTAREGEIRVFFR